MEKRRPERQDRRGVPARRRPRAGFCVLVVREGLQWLGRPGVVSTCDKRSCRAGVWRARTGEQDSDTAAASLLHWLPCFVSAARRVRLLVLGVPSLRHTDCTHMACSAVSSLLLCFWSSVVRSQPGQELRPVRSSQLQHSLSCGAGSC